MFTCWRHWRVKRIQSWETLRWTCPTASFAKPLWQLWLIRMLQTLLCNQTSCTAIIATNRHVHGAVGKQNGAAMLAELDSQQASLQASFTNRGPSSVLQS
ncbi:hypothetical protein WJX77_000948 [Trebouxia sp. C0004]